MRHFNGLGERNGHLWQVYIDGGWGEFIEIPGYPSMTTGMYELYKPMLDGKTVRARSRRPKKP